jgi:putative transposase
MARPLRIDVPNGLAHITARGNNRAAVFGTAEHRDRLLATVGRVVSRYRWICHAYVVMHNHYHLLVETPLPNLSLGMRQLNGLFAQWFNRRHGRSGHVFGGRFASISVERDEHMLESGRYIVLNPLRTMHPEHFSDWRWSSYQATAGIAEAPGLLTTDVLLGFFHAERAIAERNYVEFVAEGVGDALRERLVGEIYLGSDDFVRGLMPGERLEDVPRAQWQPVRPTLDDLGSEPAAMLDAYRSYGYRLREIGMHAGVHPATVSRALARLEREEAAVRSELLKAVGAPVQAT